MQGVVNIIHKLIKRAIAVAHVIGEDLPSRPIMKRWGMLEIA